MTTDLKNEIYLVITDFAIAEAKNTEFTNYERFCDYIHKSLKTNRLDMVIDYIQNIVKGCNEFFGFGDEMYEHVFDFFTKQKYSEHYKLINLIISIYGHYIK